ncbi:hypothetical protein WS71_22420 [Burkholderia mayonis]|uniref:Uncharacterized protein n=1 Tax=Burkholderia mayonis TaxID=1385591 RepID=A0A1B4G259_9BURK|nr:hypothetical protein WS71_22420 [Burkholderia mayonis]KVE53929.1 hypothetical protein WS71_05480 [Burkholderia mayonis]
MALMLWFASSSRRSSSVSSTVTRLLATMTVSADALDHQAAANSRSGSANIYLRLAMLVKSALD